MKKIPSKIVLDKYYENQFRYSDGLVNESIIRARCKQVLKRIRARYPFAKTICDVGSGHGFFLDEAKKQGYKVFGIEPSKQLAHTAAICYKVPQFVGSLEAYLEKYRKQFDIVTCIHVIEHIIEPKKFINSLLRLVKPKGTLFLETPNSDSHLLYAEKDKYTFLIPPEHVWIFSKESIKQLLPKNSYITSTNTYSYSEHFMGIVKKIINTNKKATKKTNSQIDQLRNTQKISFKKWLSYILFDKILAPLLTPLLNAYHKGSILELYIKKN